jgi:hypothetical protein
MRRPCRWGNTARGTSPDGAYRWLHAKPLNAATGQVLASYRPGGRHGRRHRSMKTQHTTQLLASDYRTFLLTKVVIFITRNGFLRTSSMRLALCKCETPRL